MSVEAPQATNEQQDVTQLRVFNRGGEIVTRERAVAMAQAAEHLGGISVNVLKNEGEQYGHVGKHVGSFGSRDRLYKGTVPEGHEYVYRSGAMPTNGEFVRLTDEKESVIHEEITKQEVLDHHQQIVDSAKRTVDGLPGTRNFFGEDTPTTTAHEEFIELDKQIAGELSTNHQDILEKQARHEMEADLASQESKKVA